MRLRFIWLLLAVLMAPLLVTSPVQAATPGSGNLGITGLTISPLTFDLDAKPGDQITRDLKIENVTTATLNLQATPRNFVASGETSYPRIVDEESQFSLSEWVTVMPAQFTLAPKTSTSLRISINVPDEASPGSHFGAVTVKTIPQPGEGQVAIVQEVASLVFVKTPGDAKESAEIESFTATPWFSEKGPIKLDLRLKNTGNVHFKPLINVAITDWTGKKVADLQYEKGNVLPQSIRRYTTTWTPNSLFGKYSATASVVYGSKNEVLQSTSTFWGFPIVPILIFLGLLLLLIVILYLLRHRLKAGLNAFLRR